MLKSDYDQRLAGAQASSATGKALFFFASLTGATSIVGAAFAKDRPAGLRWAALFIIVIGMVPILCGHGFLQAGRIIVTREGPGERVFHQTVIDRVERPLLFFIILSLLALIGIAIAIGGCLMMAGRWDRYLLS